MSSESFHWTRQDSDMCQRVDMCPNLVVSSENFHWTQVTPLKISKMTKTQTIQLSIQLFPMLWTWKSKQLHNNNSNLKTMI